MKGVNKAILVGTLGKDPEVKYAANGNAIANISVATSESWTDKSTGQKQEKTEWHRVVVYGKLAEIAGQYLTKGSQVYFEGKIKTRKWTDQNSGQDRYSTEINVDSFGGVMQMLGGGNQNSQQQGQQNQSQQPQQQGQYVQNGQALNPQQVQNKQAGNFQQPPMNPAPNNFDDSDVPFSMKATSPELFQLV